MYLYIPGSLRLPAERGGGEGNQGVWAEVLLCLEAEVFTGALTLRGE